MTKQPSQRGAALLLAVMMLSFLALIGGALIVGVTLDAQVSLNYRTATQLLYLAESGIEEGRETLRTSTTTPSQLLAAAVGPDGLLSTAADLDTLQSSDDVPLIRVDTPSGSHVVYLRNDAADGLSSPVDTNGVLTLVSIAWKGAARKTIEATVRRSLLPRLPATLTLDGVPAVFTPSIAVGFGVRGIDVSPLGIHGHAVGVIAETDRLATLLAIPSSQAGQYPGSSTLAPPPPDAAVVESDLDIRMKNPGGLERLAREFQSVADDNLRPAWNAAAHLDNAGSPSSYRLIAIDGDCSVGPGTGYGALLVRGVLTFTGNVQWNGVILVLGQGAIVATSGGSVQVSGGILAARTHNNDRSSTNPLGTLRTDRGPVSADFSGAGTGGIGLDRSGEDALNRMLPYIPIAIKEY